MIAAAPGRRRSQQQPPDGRIIQDANKCIREIQRPFGNSFRRFMERGI